MSDCMIFIVGTTGGNPPGTINLQGNAQEESRGELNQFSCHVNYRDNAATMQAKIKQCVIEMYLKDFGVTIGGADKITIMGGPV